MTTTSAADVYKDAYHREKAENERLTKERDLALANADAVYARLMPEIERLRAAPEQIATMIEGYNEGQIKMAAGEMTAQEMRTVKAVQRWWVSAIRHKAEALNQQRLAAKAD